MAQVDFRECQLTLKLVYYGPPLSGKTTNLQHIHSRVRELNRGRLMTLDTKDDRTLFFDLLPLFFHSSKLSFRVKVYTVPGQPLHETTRRVVLNGVDGVAFVADSQRSRMSANNKAYEDLLRNLESVGLDPKRVPIVIQYNKRDLPDTVSDGELGRIAEQNPEPIYRAAAIRGDGVFHTFFGLLADMWDAVERDFGIQKGFGISREEFLASMNEHMGVTTSGKFAAVRL